MRRTVLFMLSTNSLSAFSSAATTRIDRSGPIQAVRDRAPMEAPGGVAAAQAKPSLPSVMPQGPTPRGSLLNLSV